MIEGGETRWSVLDETQTMSILLEQKMTKLQNQISREPWGNPVAVLVYRGGLGSLGWTIFLIPQFATIYRSAPGELPSGSPR